VTGVTRFLRIAPRGAGHHSGIAFFRPRDAAKLLVAV